MNIIDRAKSFLERYRGEKNTSLRARPGQELEAAQWIYAPGRTDPRVVAQYALNAWVYTAVQRLAEMGSMLADLRIVARGDASRQYANHPILELLGVYGMPNKDQDSLEFFEQHFTSLELSGNSYWYWSSARGARIPDQVYILDSTCIDIVPGSDGVGIYDYWHMGERFRLLPQQLTHFKKVSPFSYYYGLSATEVLMGEITSDRKMLKWNDELFSAGAPSGILVIPSSTTDADRDRLDLEMNARHGSRRRMGIVRADPGAVVWVDAAMKHREMEFKEGRLLSRRAVFDAMGLPTGLMEPTSTEAHARVADRQLRTTLWGRHRRTASRINNVLGYWPNGSSRAAQFEDIRIADWQLESMRLTAIAPITTINERRATINLAPVPWGENEPLALSAPGNEDQENAAPTSD